MCLFVAQWIDKALVRIQLVPQIIFSKKADEMYIAGRIEKLTSLTNVSKIYFKNPSTTMYNQCGNYKY